MRKIKTMAIKANNKVTELMLTAKCVLANKKGEGYVDSAIKIIIAIVIGGLFLAGLYTLFNTVVIPNMTTRVTNMFNYQP